MRLRPAILFVLPAALAAQGVVPPFQLGQVNPLPSLSAPSIPGNSVLQIHLIHLPSDPPNVFLCGATATSLPAAFGGVGSADLVSGSFDVLANTFTPNTEAATLNTASYEFGLTIHHSGLHAVFDRAGGRPWLASRAAVGQPWQIVGQFTQLPSRTFFDPALADYQGQTWLLHQHGTTAIAMTPINLTNATLAGPSDVIVNATPGRRAHSPTPVLDPNGQLIGLSHHEGLGIESDHYMSLDLDPNTPSVLMNDATVWTNNGGFAGGRFFDAQQAPSPHVFSIDTVWFTGGRAPVGATMHVRMFTPPTTGSELYLSLFAVSDVFLAAGSPFPPLQGLLGINPGTGPASGLIGHDNRNGEALISFAIPNVAALSGTRVPVQGATIAAVANVVYLGNTASLTVD